MYLLSQLWGLLTIAFLLGALAGYLLWRHCVLQSWVSHYQQAEAGVTSKLATIEQRGKSFEDEAVSLKSRASLLETDLTSARGSLDEAAAKFALVQETERKLRADVSASAARERDIGSELTRQKAELESHRRQADEAARKHAEALKAAETAAQSKIQTLVTAETQKHTAEIAATKTAAEAAAKQHLDGLAKSHADELANVRRQADEAARKHTDALKAAETTAETRIQTLVASDTQKHAAETAAAKSAAEAATKQRLDALTKAHADELASVRRQAEEAAREHAEALKAAETTAESRIQTLVAADTQKHTAEIAATKSAAESAATQRLDALAKTHADELASLSRKAEEAARKHAEALEAAETAAQSKIQTLVTADTQKLTAEIAAAKNTAEATAKQRLDVLIKSHADELATAAARHANEVGRLAADISAASRAQAALSERPPILYAARGGKPDDLKLIWGVGEKLEKQLHDLGIFHFEQIAHWTHRDLVWAEAHLGQFADRIEREKWIDQCKKLATGWRPSNDVGDRPEGYSATEKPPLLKAARNDTADEMELIWGVGPKLAEQLNKLGFYHFDQIAAWSPANVKWVEHQLGEFADRIEREKWVEQCKKLASGWRPTNQVGDNPHTL